MYFSREKVVRFCASFLCIISLSACGDMLHKKESAFYAENETAIERKREIKKYSFQEQWEIYHYGWTQVDPGPVDMSGAISQSGEGMLKFIFQKLDKSSDNTDFLMAIFAFKDMQNNHFVNICGNDEYLNKIRGYTVNIQDDYDRDVYATQYSTLCKHQSTSK